MKLYLSSYRLGENPQTLAEMFRSNKSVAVIANSMDFLTDELQRQEAAAREIKDLKDLGLEPEEVDLRDYFGKSELLSAKLSKFGGIWSRGGNVFILRRAYKESGLDEWLKEHRSNPEFVYAGYSAGVCLLAPSLKGLEIVDDPNKVPDKYATETEWSGLNLISYSIAPHYMSPHPESEAVNLVVEFFNKENIEYKTLKDGEVRIDEIK